jgi:hypothetical protein
MPDELRASIQNTLMVLTNGGDSQKWNPKPATGGSSTRLIIRDPAKYAAAEASAICYNRGVKGHRVRNCKLPLTKPFKFAPARMAAGVPANPPVVA